MAGTAAAAELDEAAASGRLGGEGLPLDAVFRGVEPSSLAAVQPFVSWHGVLVWAFAGWGPSLWCVFRGARSEQRGGPLGLTPGFRLQGGQARAERLFPLGEGSVRLPVAEGDSRVPGRRRGPDAPRVRGAPGPLPSAPARPADGAAAGRAEVRPVRQPRPGEAAAEHAAPRRGGAGGRRRAGAPSPGERRNGGGDPRRDGRWRLLALIHSWRRRRAPEPCIALSRVGQRDDRGAVPRVEGERRRRRSAPPAHRRVQEGG